MQIMIKKFITLGAAALMTLAASAQDPYKIVAPVGTELNGATVYLLNYDTAAQADSAVVEAGTATFKGTVDEPFLGVIRTPAMNIPVIVECGTVAITDNGRKAIGSPLNDLYNDFHAQLADLQSQYQAAATDAEKDAIETRYNQVCDSTMRANLDNPIALAILLMDGMSYELSLEEMEALVAKEPSLASSERLSKNLDMKRRSAATGEGKQYADFEVNGQKLSDYVGKDGKYLLVDFWASWCGPCRREIPVIKSILEENSDRLNVLGVAVWDEPDNTREAMEQLKITWPVIIDAQRIPTDIYGILGIPTIILIGPDGTILVRDKQGKELKAAVEAALGK